MHPAAAGTKYAGTLQTTLFNGSASGQHETTIDRAVKPGDALYRVSVTNSITEMPVEYGLKIDLVATTILEESPQRIQDNIPAMVK